jgi:hypothetical protein
MRILERLDPFREGGGVSPLDVAEADAAWLVLTSRAQKVEMRLAHMKRVLKLDRLRLRGLSGARDEVLLTATAQNLRRLVKILGRAPPSLSAVCLA